MLVQATDVGCMQAIAAAEAELQGPQCASRSEDGFTVDCEPLGLDLPSCSPNTVLIHLHCSQSAVCYSTGFVTEQWLHLYSSEACKARATT